MYGDNTSAINRFRLKVAHLCTTNRQHEFYSKAFQQEHDDKSAETNAYIGVGLLDYLFTTACRNVLAMNKIPHNPARLLHDTKQVNTRQNLTSATMKSNLLPDSVLDDINDVTQHQPHQKFDKAVLATIRAVFHLVHATDPILALETAETIVYNTTMSAPPVESVPVEEHRVCLPPPPPDTLLPPLPSSIFLENTGMGEQNLTVNFANRTNSQYFLVKAKGGSQFRCLQLAPKLFPDLFPEANVYIDKDYSLAIAIIKIKTGDNVVTKTFTSSLSSSNTSAKKEVSTEAVEYMIKNFKTEMTQADELASSVDDDESNKNMSDDEDKDDSSSDKDDNHGQQPPRKMQKVGNLHEKRGNENKMEYNSEDDEDEDEDEAGDEMGKIKDKEEDEVSAETACAEGASRSGQPTPTGVADQGTHAEP
jgi:hypothetical protein